jgi:DUF1365 family protein
MMGEAFRPRSLFFCFDYPAQIHHATLGVDIDPGEIREVVARQLRLHGGGN